MSGFRLHPIWILVIAIVGAMIGFGAITILGLESGNLILGLGGLLLGAVVVWFLVTVLLIFGVWVVWMHIPRSLQLGLSIFLFIVGLLLLEVGVGVEIDILAVMGFIFYAMGTGRRSGRGK